MMGQLHEYGIIVKNLAMTQGASILFLVLRSTCATSTHDMVARS